jgi:beta-glucosidase/6-phospho-beta-glucosidase/beta-galactosidase
MNGFKKDFKFGASLSGFQFKMGGEESDSICVAEETRKSVLKDMKELGYI